MVVAEFKYHILQVSALLNLNMFIRHLNRRHLSYIALVRLPDKQEDCFGNMFLGFMQLRFHNLSDLNTKHMMKMYYMHTKVFSLTLHLINIVQMRLLDMQVGHSGSKFLYFMLLRFHSRFDLNKLHTMKMYYMHTKALIKEAEELILKFTHYKQELYNLFN